MTTSYARGVRLLGGTIALLLWLVARGTYVSAGGDPLSSVDRIVGTGLHLIASVIALAVFFVSESTRVRNIVPLADRTSVLERTLPGRSESLQRDIKQLRSKTSMLWFAAAFAVLVLLIWLFAAATYLGPEAETIVTRRMSPLLAVLILSVAVLSLVAGFGTLSGKPWALRLGYLAGIPYSFAFPIGVAFTFYIWWCVRSLGEASELKLEASGSAI